MISNEGPRQKTAPQPWQQASFEQPWPQQAAPQSAEMNGSEPPAPQGCCPAFAGSSGRPGSSHYFAVHDRDGALDSHGTRILLPASDLMMAKAMQVMLRDAGRPVLHGAQSGRWHQWDGTHYAPQEELFGHRIADWAAIALRDVLHDVSELARAASAGDEKRRAELLDPWKPHHGYLGRLWGAGGQAALVSQLAVVCGVDDSALDADPGEIVVDNGVISYDQILRDGYVRLLPHDPARLITRRMGRGVVWDPSATCPVFDRFLETSVADAAQRDWLLWRTVSALFGRMPRKGFVNPIGEGDSGKSTFVEIMHRLGGGYVTTVPVETFLAHRGGDSGFRQAELRGARMVCATEPRPGGRYDDGFMKTITGRDRQRTAGKYEKPVQWTPQLTPFIGSNSPISFATSDAAFMSRQEVIRFARGYEHRDEELLGKMAGELPGILTRLLAYAVREACWGLPPLPASMAAERELLAVETEPALAFIAEWMDRGWLIEQGGLPVYRYAQVGQLYQAFRDWCEREEGVRDVPGRKTFSAIIGRKWPTVRSNGLRFSGLVGLGS